MTVSRAYSEAYLGTLNSIQLIVIDSMGRFEECAWALQHKACRDGILAKHDTLLPCPEPFAYAAQREHRLLFFFRQTGPG